MKSILYLGVLLMASAAIYGFVDYERSGGQPTFDKLYSEEPMPVAQEVPAPPSKPLIENVVFPPAGNNAGDVEVEIPASRGKRISGDGKEEKEEGA